MSTLALFAAATEAAGNHLPIPPWSFGVLTLVIFVGLLFVVFAFRGSIGTMTYADHGAHGSTGQGHGNHGHGAHGQGSRH
ncbi:MAG: hypothetical protein Q4G43_09615 [Mobilicoccus sp.]|nr:hypothetical protein [Mobilicoccus sp.]